MIVIKEMEGQKALLLIHILTITILEIHADNFIKPSSEISDIATKSKAISVGQSCSGVQCYKKFCAGRHSTPNSDYIIDSDLDSLCKDSMPVPSHSNKTNGYVHYKVNNYQNCTVSKDFNGQEYTLSFWVNYKCGSGSDCSISLSSSVTVNFNGSMELAGQNFSVSANTWYFIVLKKNTRMDTVYINGSRKSQSVNLPINVQLKIDPDKFATNDFFKLVDMRLYKVSLTDREITQIFTKSQAIDGREPYTECRCPPTFPGIVDTNTSFSLLCATDDGMSVTGRFINGSIPLFMIDNDASTFFQINQTFSTISLEFTDTYQIDEIEVKVDTTPCNTTFVLGSGLRKTITPPYGDSLKWSSIGNNLQTRNQYEQATSNKLEIQLDVFCGSSENYHQIKEVIVTGRCNCYGNSHSCNYGSGNLCNCQRNTAGSNCQNCAEKFYRQADSFGCLNSCQCDERGSGGKCVEVGGRCLCKTNVEGTSCDTCKPLYYNISSANDEGCTRSSCHEKGTLRCNNNVTCDSCECKSNVTSANCDRCLSNHYGLNLFNDGCKACDCNMAGSKRVSCNVNTGQCTCKSQANGGKTVEGRQCDTCVDGYYGLHVINSAGCIGCSCNKYGSTTETCNKESGQCTCNIGSQNKRCDPVITSMEPSFGPQAGGTIVTLRGHHLGQGTSSGSTLSILALTEPLTVTKWTQEEVVFETKTTSKNSVTLTFKWATATYGNGADIFRNKTFQYKPNPSVTGVKSLTSYRRGGCDIQISGKNLNSVYRPQLKSYLANNVQQLTDCTALGSSVLVCKSPNVTDTETRFNYGLVLDGVTMYSNLSNQFSQAEVNVVNNPVVRRKEYDDYKMLFSDTITIQGSHLKTACPQNLKITIGNVNCLIESATNDSIVCKPDISFPGINMEDTSIMVEMGDYKVTAGLITFIEFWKTIEFIGIAIGAACGVFLILLIVVCCCYRRRKRGYSGKNTKKVKIENGFDRPATASSVHKLTAVEKEEVPRFSNRLYSQKQHLETALSYDNTDCSEDFLHKIESTVREKIQRSVSDRKHIEPDKVCTLKGTEIRVINGTFSKESPKAGSELTIKTNVKVLKDLLKDNKYPPWLNNGLLECMKFQDCFHDNIIGILGISVDQNRFYIMYPYSTRVFKEYLKDAKNEFTEKQQMEMCAQIANGMSFIDKENMVHKDLATRNCVVMPDGYIKISDASFSWNLYPDEYMFDKEKQRYLPVRWMSLESLTMGFYDISSDVWSFGVLIWEVMTLASYLPYHDQTNDQSIKGHIADGFRLGMPTNISDDLYGLMVNCWEGDNTQRPTFDEIFAKLNVLMDPESLYVNQAFK